MNTRHTFLFFAAALLLANAVSAQQPDLQLDGVTQPDSTHLEAHFTIINQLGDANGTLSISTNDNLQLDTSNGNWQCARVQAPPKNTCSTQIAVTGKQTIALRFAVRQFFDSDFVYAWYKSPALNYTVATKFLVSQPYDPTQIASSAQFYLGLLSLLVGLLAWLCGFESGKLKYWQGMAGKVFSAIDNAILAWAIVSSLLIAGGVWLIFSPSYSLSSMALFAAVFAASVFFLLQARQPTGAARFGQNDSSASSASSISAHRRRLEEMVRREREKLMRKQVDEKSFRSTVQKLEMQIAQLEAEEKKKGI